MINNVLYLIGGTCSGKTSLARILERRGWNWVRSITTRPRRPGETDEYKAWISHTEFAILAVNGALEFVREYATHSVLWRYAFLKEDLAFELDKRYVMIGDPVSAQTAMRRYGTTLMLYASNDTTISRLKARGCTGDFIRQRLSKDYDDFGRLRVVAAQTRPGGNRTLRTAKNDNHYDRTKILNWLDERFPE